MSNTFSSNKIPNRSGGSGSGNPSSNGLGLFSHIVNNISKDLKNSINNSKTQYTAAAPIVNTNAGNSNPIVNNVSSSPESFIRQLSNENSARNFQFNAEEAEKSRAFSEYMSNTSHQREVEDLKRAGLNPVLSANGGAASYSAASASGSADSSAVGAIASLYATKLNNDNAAKIADMQLKSNQYIAQLNNYYNKEVAKINAAASKYASDNSYSASKYSADNAYYAAKYSSDNSTAAQRYSADRSYSANKYSSDNSVYASKYASDNSVYASNYAADRSKYGLIDNFVNSILGNSSSKNSSASKSLGKKINNVVKKYFKK